MKTISILTLNDFQQANQLRTALPDFHPECQAWIEAQWFREMIGEIGEAANILKKVDRGDFKLEGEHLTAFMDEVGDALATFCNWINKVNRDHNLSISISTCGIMKYNKVNEKYNVQHKLEEELPVQNSDDAYEEALAYDNELIKGLNK